MKLRDYIKRLTRSAEKQPRNVIVKHQDHQQNQNKQPDLLRDFPDLDADRTSFHGFY